MDALTIERTKAIYRSAIDARAADGEGEAWWSEVQAEVAEVLAARTLCDAAAVIAWWHSDWSMVGDTSRAAAKRLREAARTIKREAAK